MSIDIEERLDILHSNVNTLYLEVGNMKEILSMSYWRFLSVLQSARDRSTRNSGKPVVRNKLYQSQRDMIQRTKELMEK